MTTYVYKSITGRPVNADDYVVTVDPGLQFDRQIEELDAYIGVSIARYDDGVLSSSDNTYRANLFSDSSSTGIYGPLFQRYSIKRDWYIQPSAYLGNPLSDGTIADISSSSDRTSQLAGMGAPIVLSGVSRFGGNIQWGTKSTADSNYAGSSTDTAYTATPANVQTSASAWLKFKDNTNGTQEYAMGRVVKYPEGTLRFCQYADDALVGSCPRVQWFLSPLMNLRKYRFILDVQFGDSTTPFPSYLVNKDQVLFFQLKGAATQPVIAAVAMYDSATSNTLTVQFNVKRTNGGTITTIAQCTGVPIGTRTRFEIEGLLSWTSSGFWKVYNDGEYIGGLSGNTLMSDYADSVQPMFGIYRYGHSGTKASDDCAIIFYEAGVENI